MIWEEGWVWDVSMDGRNEVWIEVISWEQWRKKGRLGNIEWKIEVGNVCMTKFNKNSYLLLIQ